MYRQQGILSDSFYESSVTLIPKRGKDTTTTTMKKRKKKKLQTNILYEHDVKILSKTPVNRIQQHIEKTTHCEKVRFLPAIQEWFNICRSINVLYHISRMKYKNHMKILIDAEESFDKTKHQFTIKSRTKLDIEGTYHNIIKAIYNMPTANNILNCEKLKAFSLRNKLRIITFIQHSTEGPSLGNQARERKGIEIKKKEVKLIFS